MWKFGSKTIVIATSKDSPKKFEKAISKLASVKRYAPLAFPIEYDWYVIIESDKYHEGIANPALLMAEDLESLIESLNGITDVHDTKSLVLKDDEFVYVTRYGDRFVNFKIRRFVGMDDGGDAGPEIAATHDRFVEECSDGHDVAEEIKNLFIKKGEDGKEYVEI